MNATSTADVAAMLKQATKGNSKVAKNLEQVKTNKDMQKVFALVKKDKKLAAILAETLINAET